MRNTVFEKYYSFFSQFPPRVYKKDEIVIRPDDAMSFLYYVKSGYIHSYKISENGEHIPYLIFKTGDILPLECFIENTRNTWYFQSITTVEVFRIPYLDFKELVSRNPQMLYDLSSHMTAALLRIAESIENLAVGTAYYKVLSRIMYLAKYFGIESGKNTITIPIPFTQDALAKSIGMTRETTSIHLKKLERDGIIEYKGHFIVLKQNKLYKVHHQVVSTVASSV